MKSLNVLGQDVLKRVFPEIVKSGFKSKTTFFSHTIDINRRVENLYSNFFTKFENENVELKPLAFGLKFEVWGMELGRVTIPLQITGRAQSSNNKNLKKDLIELICKCDRIKQTGFAPTHLVVIITTRGKEWEQTHYEIYYLEKWQSDLIASNSSR